METEEELSEFVEKIEIFVATNCPSWLTSNSYFVGIKPGHNLDLLEISFDFRIDRTHMILSRTPEILKDPSKAALHVVKE